MRYWIRGGKNLIMYDKQPDTTYWTERWGDETLDDLVKGAEKSRPMLVKAFSKYLPRKGKILEAGCGLGPWVKILLERGYDIEGIDSSEMTIDRAKAFDASLPVSVGNVLKLDYPDEYFDGYISKGVAEHFEDGPTAMLVEAHRVLKHDGILMITVPHFNPLRMVTVIRSRCDESKSKTFFQYGFTVR